MATRSMQDRRPTNAAKGAVVALQAFALAALSLAVVVPEVQAQRRPSYSPPPPPPPPPPRPAASPSVRPQGGVGAGPMAPGARPGGASGMGGMGTQPRPPQFRPAGTVPGAGGGAGPGGGAGMRPGAQPYAVQMPRNAPPSAPLAAMRGYQGHTTPEGKPVYSFQGRNYQVPHTGASQLRAEAMARAPAGHSARLRDQLAAAAAPTAAPRPPSATAAPVKPAFNGTSLVSGHAQERAARSGISQQDIGEAIARGSRRTLPNGLEVLSTPRATVVRTPGGAVVGVYPPGTPVGSPAPSPRPG